MCFGKPEKKQNVDINLIDKYIKKGQVTIFSKTYCPFCKKIKEYFKGIEVDYVSYEIDKNDLTEIEVKSLHLKTGCKTYPNIFIGLNNTKGCSETLNLVESGELFKLMDENEIKYNK